MRARLTGLASALCLALVSVGAGPAPVDLALLTAEEPPPLLSQFRLFTDHAAREPNVGVTPYRLNTPLFTDYARKSRFLYLPPGARARYVSGGLLEFPVGSALVKTFAYPKVRGGEASPVETRLLIRTREGWRALTYVWNDRDGDARLKRAGANLEIDSVNDAGAPIHVAYHVPNLNECKTCHSVDGVITPLGPKARNLNGPDETGRVNQLDRFRELGLIDGAPPSREIPRTAAFDDSATPADLRARAYLDVNCGHCHNPKGFASNSGLFLTWEETDASALGVGKPPVAAGRGSGGLMADIEPGDPDHSILIYRMGSTEPGVMMPPLGRSLVHDEGLKAVRAYIASLKKAR